METPPSSSSGYLQHIPPSLRWRKKSLVMVASPSALFCSAAVSPGAPGPVPGVVATATQKCLDWARPPLPSVHPCSSVAAFSVVVPVIYHDPLCARIHFKGRLQLWCIVHSLCAGLDQTGRLRTRTSYCSSRIDRATQPIPLPHVTTRENETTSVLPRGERGKLSWSRCSATDSISRSILSLSLHGYDRSVGAESSSF